MGINEITIEKAMEHNLKGICVSIPKNTLTVLTGPSGSGKSSLAFDTIYVEGQRRYIESLSSYARQFLGQYGPPKVESITGLSPAIAIDQKSTSKNPRSTVGTVTEIYDYLRVLYARVGILYCPDSGEQIKSYSPGEITNELMKLPAQTKIHILAPVIYQKKGELKEEISSFLAQGFNRIRINGKIHMLDEEFKLSKSKKHTLEIVIDRLIIRENIEKRLTDSIEYALKKGLGTINVLIGDDKEKVFSEKNISPVTRKHYPNLEPRLFSFNSPLGACQECNGLGLKKTFDAKLLIADSKISILEGAIPTLLSPNRFIFKMLRRVANNEKIDLKTPYDKLPKSFKHILFYGSEKEYNFIFNSENSRFSFKKKFPGIINALKKKYMETGSERLRRNLEKYMNVLTCQNCSGKRLNTIALSTKIDGKNIMDVCEQTVKDIYFWVTHLVLPRNKKIIAERLLKEIATRLNFLLNVGLDYLSLNRAAMTLSGGESQRIRLATQIGSALSGVLYVLDEPSIGLHQRDNHRLLKTLFNLRYL
ncbi:MAG: excinuclease ABC subunit UvrA, partial [Halobacteriovoraceae bacterium]|nr:excinuclease ABC subunit UvrA [Halobacteriovoraceae bacterium]